MSDLLPCPRCLSEYTYEDNGLYMCPECAHEWSKNEMADTTDNDKFIVRDANGNLLNEGDFVTVIKDLKIKGSSSIINSRNESKNTSIG